MIDVIQLAKNTYKSLHVRIKKTPRGGCAVARKNLRDLGAVRAHRL